jgi:hypothetical protein
MRISSTALVTSAFILAAGAFTFWHVRAPRTATGPVSTESAVPTKDASVSTDAEALTASANIERDQVPTALPEQGANVVAAANGDTQEDPIFEFARRYGEYARRAEAGDVEAARTLYLNIQTCSGFARSAAEVEASIEEQQAQGGLKTPDAAKQSRENQLRDMRRCSVLSDEQLASLGHWLEVGAELGDADARLRFVEGGGPSDKGDGRFYGELRAWKEQAMRYVEQEIARGNPLALRAAAEGYMYGNAFPRDPTKAYAYAYAFQLSQGQQNNSALSAWVQILRSKVPEGEGNLAEQLGRQVYAECCTNP